jgi:hypothetical protein
MSVSASRDDADALRGTAKRRVGTRSIIDTVLAVVEVALGEVARIDVVFTIRPARGDVVVRVEALGVPVADAIAVDRGLDIVRRVASVREKHTERDKP